MKQKFRARRATAASAFFGMLSLALAQAPEAQASGIPFAGNRPQSFQFISGFTEPYNSFAQYFQFNDDATRFDANGDRVDGPGTTTFVGQTSLLQYLKVDALPHNGFVLIATIPEVAVRGEPYRTTGIGDPLVGGLAWWNPTPLRTFAAQVYVQVPWGSDSLSSDTVSYWPSISYDEWFSRVNVDFLIGGVLHEEKSHGIDLGDTTHVNLRLGYKFKDAAAYEFTPFLAYDFQRTWRSKDDIGEAIPDSDSRETALGFGILLQIKPGFQPLYHQKTWDQFSIHYSKGIDGRNTTVTDGLYMQFWHYW